MNGNNDRRLAAFDGLRGIAAIAVMLYHVGNFYDVAGPFMRGYLLVDLFFLLSGFVLALSAEPRFAGGWTTTSFVRARIKRLWPMIVVGALLGALSFGWRNGWDDVPVYFVLGLSLLPLIAPFGRGQLYPLNPPQWSLLFEVAANLLHGLVLRRLGDRALLAFVAISGAALIWAAYTMGSNTCGPYAATWYLGLPRVAFAYALGVWMGRRHSAGASGFPVRYSVVLLLPLLAMVTASATQNAVWLVDSLIVVVAFPLIVWLAASAIVPAGAERWLDRLGIISFPLYTIHVPIVALLAAISPSAISLAASIVASLTGSWLLAAALERRRVRAPSQALVMEFAR